jgi:branched-chain amino acid transport system permease protein
VGIYLTAFFAGLGTGGIYALVALSYNLIYSSTGVFNFAQGDLLTLGSLLTFSLLVTAQWSVLAAVVPVMLAVALVALLQHRITVVAFVRPGRSSFSWVITTLGASVVLENLFQLIWGSQPLGVPSLWEGKPITILGSPVPRTSIIIVAVALLSVLALEYMARKTLFGRAWRATAEDAEAASVRGIDVGRVGAISFMAAGALSGLAGLVIAPVAPVVFSSGALLSLQVFVALVIGGFGSPKGALFGGFILGVAQAEAALILSPNYTDIVTLALLLTVLMVRPLGLFGVQHEREV